MAIFQSGFMSTQVLNAALITTGVLFAFCFVLFAFESFLSHNFKFCCFRYLGTHQR